MLQKFNEINKQLFYHYSAYVNGISADSEHTFLLALPIQGSSSKAGLTHDLNNTYKHDGKPMATAG